MKAAASVFHIAGRRSALRKRLPDVESIAVLPPTPVPPIERECSTFLPRGEGPWQRKARGMKSGESVVLTHAHADALRGACRKLSIRTKTRKFDEHQTQVWIYHPEKKEP